MRNIRTRGSNTTTLIETLESRVLLSASAVEACVPLFDSRQSHFGGLIAKPGSNTTTPIGTAVTGTTSNSVALAWADVSTNESGYYVYRSADGINFSRIASIAAGSTAYTDAGLASGTHYSYEIGAWNSGGENDTGAITA